MIPEGRLLNDCEGVGSYYDDYWSVGVAGWNVAAELSPGVKSLLVHHTSGKRVVDFGGGDGMRYAHVVRPVASHYVVTDVSEAVLRSREVMGDDTLHAEALAERPERFDVILVLEVLEHLLDPAGVLRLLATKMEPQATLIASVPNAFSLVNRVRMLAGRLPSSGVGGLGVRGRTYLAPHVRFFDRVSLCNILADAGLRIGTLFGDGVDCWKLALPLKQPLIRLKHRSGLIGDLAVRDFFAVCTLAE